MNSLGNCEKKNADESWDTRLHRDGCCIVCVGTVFGQQIVLHGQYISVSKFTIWSSFKIQPQCVVFCVLTTVFSLSRYKILNEKQMHLKKVGTSVPVSFIIKWHAFSRVLGRKLWKVYYSVRAALIAMCYSACKNIGGPALAGKGKVTPLCAIEAYGEWRYSSCHF